MDPWIPITIAAAFFQNLRFMLQKVLKDTSLSAGGATFARFLYGAPLAAILLAGLLAVLERRIPAIGLEFLAFACVGGLAQIIATSCVVALFSERNYVQTEWPVQSVRRGFDGSRDHPTGLEPH